jgi:hypothetical protein
MNISLWAVPGSVAAEKQKARGWRAFWREIGGDSSSGAARARTSRRQDGDALRGGLADHG